MLPQPPGIIERHAVVAPASEDDHHAAGGARSADAGGVVDSGGRVFGTSVYFLPGAVACYIDFPDIAHGLWAGITPVDYDIRLQVCHYVAVSSSRGGALAVFDLPVGLVSERQKVKLVETIVCQLPSPERPSEHVEEVVDWYRIMSCSVRGRDAVIIEFLPLPEVVVEEEGVAGDDVLAGVAHCPSEQDGLLLADGGDGVPEAGRGTVSRELGLLHVMWCNLF